jgi:hypothetical protein
MICGGILRNRGMGSVLNLAAISSGRCVLVRFHNPSMAGPLRPGFAAIVNCTTFFVELLVCAPSKATFAVRPSPAFA